MPTPVEGNGCYSTLRPTLIHVVGIKSSVSRQVSGDKAQMGARLLVQSLTIGHIRAIKGLGVFGYHQGIAAGRSTHGDAGATAPQPLPWLGS